MSHRQLGMHSPVAVHAAEVDVDLGDEVAEPRVADRPLRRRPGTLCVEAGLGHFEDRRASCTGETLGDHHLDGRVSPLGWRRPSAARSPVNAPQLGLEVADALAGRDELGLLGRR
jgi:hypothetical protein